MDAKKIVAALDKKSDKRDTVALYLDTDVVARFKAACERLERKHGRVLEQLMTEFSDSADAEKPKGKK